MINEKLILSLHEENEINIQLQIEGTSTSANISKPTVRFILESVNQPDLSLMFPGVISEENNITVTIPPTSTLSEKYQYKGKLEVIIGNKYFCPTEIDVQFENKIKIETKLFEVAMKKHQEEKVLLKEKVDVEELDNELNMISVVKNPIHVPVKQQKKPIVEQAKKSSFNPPQKRRLPPEFEKSKNQLKSIFKNVLENWDKI